MVGEITVTDRAAEKIRALLAGAKAGYGLRVKVASSQKTGFLRKPAPESCSTRRASYI